MEEGGGVSMFLEEDGYSAFRRLFCPHFMNRRWLIGKLHRGLSLFGGDVVATPL